MDGAVGGEREEVEAERDDDGPELAGGEACFGGWIAGVSSGELFLMPVWRVSRGVIVPLWQMNILN